MHHVTEFVEEGDYFMVLHERWDITLRRIEVGNHRNSSRVDLPIDFSPLQQRKSRSVVELIWSWVQIEIELPKESLCLLISYFVNGNLLVPRGYSW